MAATIFDWIARTAMLAMAGLVTLSILGAIATMTSDPGTRFAAPAGHPVAEPKRAEEPQSAQSPSRPEAEDSEVDGQAGAQGRTAVAAQAPAPEDEEERWLEAIAYALLALAGIGALAVLMLWNVLLELRRIRRS